MGGGGGGVALGCFSSFYAMHMVFHVRMCMRDMCKLMTCECL